MTLAHGLVGLIWGAWHLAYFSFVMSYTTESAVTLVPRFLLATIAVSIVYGEIRILTNSVWPSVLMQTAGGAVLSGLLANELIHIKSSTAFLISPGVEGTLTLILCALVGVGIHLCQPTSRQEFGSDAKVSYADREKARPPFRR